ncbi:MAG TPA: substrate-binding domain-containing protein [Chloroflexota bacterium]
MSNSATMDTFQRRQRLLDHLRVKQQATVRELARLLAVSEGTVRADLATLAEQGVVERVRGGAVLRPNGAAWRGLPTRDAAPPKLQRLVQRAAELVDDGDTLLLDNSDVSYWLAEELVNRAGLTVFTNSVDVALRLARNTSHTVVLLGGILRPTTASVGGHLAERMLEGVRVRKAFFACAALSVDLGVAENDLHEVQVKAAMARSAETVVVIAESSLYGRLGLAPFVRLDQVAQLITDDALPAGALQELHEAGVTVSLCGGQLVTVAPRSAVPRRYRVAFANLIDEGPFFTAVRRSIERAAREAGNIELILADNRADGPTALANVEAFLAQGVDLVIEFQTYESYGNVIMDRLRSARIPVIAIDIPMPGATYFGADNYRSGLMGGEYLGGWVVEHWGGRVDKVISLELPRSGPTPAARMQGQIDGLRRFVPVPETDIIRLDSKNTKEEAQRLVTETLRGLPAGLRLAVVAINDQTAVGAIAALEAAGRARDAVVVSQGADRMAIQEMQRRETPLIAAVTFFPERYGDKVVPLALDILEGRPVPPAVYTEHVLITREDVQAGRLPSGVVLV